MSLNYNTLILGTHEHNRTFEHFILKRLFGFVPRYSRVAIETRRTQAEKGFIYSSAPCPSRLFTLWFEHEVIARFPIIICFLLLNKTKLAIKNIHKFQ